jgi:biotin-(acetyl-CoA carboxylase) ligase
MSIGLPQQWAGQLQPVALLAASALAVCEQLGRWVPRQSIRLKYPNDVWAKPPTKPPGKLCGMLIESDYTGAQPNSAVIGIGINHSAVPSSGKTPVHAHCLAELTAEPLPAPHVLAERITEQFLSLLLHSSSTVLVKRWQAELNLIGRAVLLRQDRQLVRVVGYSDDGTLRAESCTTGAPCQIRDSDSLIYDPFAE